jgi:hypothetical protein
LFVEKNLFAIIVHLKSLVEMTTKNADCPATIQATVKIKIMSTRKKNPFIKVE